LRRRAVVILDIREPPVRRELGVCVRRVGRASARGSVPADARNGRAGRARRYHGRRFCNKVSIVRSFATFITGASGNRQRSVRRKKPPRSVEARTKCHTEVDIDVTRTNYNRSNETPPTTDVPVRPGGGARTLAGRRGAAVRRTPPAARGGAARGEPGRGFF
jgi:hypothetical protein